MTNAIVKEKKISFKTLEKKIFEVLFEKVNSTLVWILLIPYIMFIALDFTFSIHHIFNYGLY